MQTNRNTFRSWRMALVIGVMLLPGLWLIHGRARTPTGAGDGAERQQILKAVGPWFSAYRGSSEWSSKKRGPLFADLAFHVGTLSLSGRVSEQQVVSCLGQPDVTTHGRDQKCLVYYYSNTQPNDNAVWICIRSGQVGEVRWEVRNLGNEAEGRVDQQESEGTGGEATQSGQGR